MGIREAISRRSYAVSSALIGRWLKPNVLDADRVERPGRAICYALPARSLLDLLILEIATRSAGLTSPRASLGDSEEARSFFFLARPEGLLLRRASMRRRSPRMGRIVELARAGTDLDVIPITVFWGRAPAREKSLWRLLFSERWTVTGSLRKVLTLLFDRSNLFVQFGRPIPLEEICADGDEPELMERRLARLLRTRLRGQRSAMIGPDLSHRRTLVRGVIASRAVRREIDALVEAGEATRKRAIRRAERYANEIASDMSFAAIRFFDILLTWLWHRLYDGIEVTGTAELKQTAERYTLVYVPCHRSHMDYLLLSYVLYYNGLSLPQVAAGENLNIPLAGPLLRRGGAFFMRRSFRGDPLYSAVFAEYLHRVFATGNSVEYFVEGGRSRTGRMLAAREGMLAMTLRSMLREPNLPLALVPVYFGYEKVIEVRSYMGELRGRAKEKESLLGLIRSLRNLRQSFGRVRVNFGEPIPLAPYLDHRVPEWREADSDRPAWLPALVDGLAVHVAEHINAAVSVTPVALLAAALLDTPRQALDEASLAASIDLLLEFARLVPPGPATTVPDMDGSSVIRYCEQLGVVERETLPLGDVLALTGINTVSLTWYRNNAQHAFALPSLVAALLGQGRVLSDHALERMVATVYPYLRAELFLPWQEDRVATRVQTVIGHLVAGGLVERDGEGWRMAPAETAGAARLQQLGRLIMPTLERYYIAIALVESNPGGRFTVPELEEACVLTAQRMARLYGLNAPEFFDRALFRRFIDTMIARGVLNTADEQLHYSSALPRIAVEAARVIGAEFRQGVLQTRLLAREGARAD